MSRSASARLPDSRLIATRLGSIRRVVCASPDYLATNGVPTTLDDLARHSVISFEGVSSPTIWTFESNGVAVTASFRSRLSVNTIDAAIYAGLCGVGLIRVNSYQAVDYVRSGRLAVVLEDFAPASRPVHLVYDKQKPAAAEAARVRRFRGPAPARTMSPCIHPARLSITHIW